MCAVPQQAYMQDCMIQAILPLPHVARRQSDVSCEVTRLELPVSETLKVSERGKGHTRRLAAKCDAMEAQLAGRRRAAICILWVGPVSSPVRWLVLVLLIVVIYHVMTGGGSLLLCWLVHDCVVADPDASLDEPVAALAEARRTM